MALTPTVVCATLLSCTALSAQGFVDVTTAANLSMITEDDRDGRGACCGDFDGDGDVDLIVPGYGASPMRYFANDGTGTFVERTAAANLGASNLTHCFAPADVDNDGDLDVFVGGLGADRLFLNDGTGTFAEVGAQFGVGSVLDTYSASFGDYDRDGYVDLYLGIRDSNPNLLFRNDGGIGFTDVTSVANVGADTLTFVAVWIDYDEDGWPDLYCTNDKGSTAGPNRMYRNNGDGTFTDTSAITGSGIAIDGMGCDYVDAFNDGGSDLYCSDLPPDHLFLVWHPSTGRFVQSEYTYGVAGGPTLLGWSCKFFDYDNDGWQDLHVVHAGVGPNVLFRNPGAPAAAHSPWTDVAPALGVDLRRPQYTVAIADFDDDGRLDILNVFADGPSAAPGLKLQRNAVPATGHWLRLETRGTVSNRSGFGAKIRVTTPNATQFQCVRSGVGFCSASDLRCHFGLGTASRVDRVEIGWPSGQMQVLTNVAADQTLRVQEPRLYLVGAPLLGSSPTLRLEAQGDEGRIYAMPLSLTAGPPIRLLSGRTVPIGFDGLTPASLSAGNPLAPNSVGTVSASGSAATALHIPADIQLRGVTLYATALTIDAAEPDAVRTLFPALTITLQ